MRRHGGRLASGFSDGASTARHESFLLVLPFVDFSVEHLEEYFHKCHCGLGTNDAELLLERLDFDGDGVVSSAE